MGIQVSVGYQAIPVFADYQDIVVFVVCQGIRGFVDSLVTADFLELTLEHRVIRVSVGFQVIVGSAG